MKMLFIGVVVVLLSTFAVVAQVSPTKVYLLNTSRDLKITLRKPNADEPVIIKLKSYKWAIVTMGKSDSLGLSIGGQPYYIHFDKGKNYYFTAYGDFSRSTSITEQSQREFFLSVHLNADIPPEQYTMDK